MKTYKVTFTERTDGGHVQTTEVKAEHFGVDPAGHLIFARGALPKPETLRVFAPGRWRECELVEGTVE